MKTLETILKHYPDTQAGEWHQHPNGGGWCHSSAKIKKESVYIGQDAEIRGGEIRDGVIRDGVIWGGVIWGGVIWGGVIWDGVIWGGLIWGGEIRGGEIRDGVIWDGVIWGGVIWGGVIRDGEWFTSPIQIQGSRHFANNSRPGCIQIGCHERAFDDWTANFERIGKIERYTPEQIAEYKSIIDHIVKFGK